MGPVVASVSVGSAADMLFRRKSKNTTQKPRNAANVEPEAKTSGSKSAVVLKLCLKHGDIVIMEGYDVQKLYEVCIFFLRLNRNLRVGAHSGCKRSIPSFQWSVCGTVRSV